MARGKIIIPLYSDDSSSDDGEGKPSVDELVEVVKKFRMFALSKMLNSKL